MDVPPEIAFRNIEPTDALRASIQEGIDALEKVHPRLTSCRIMVEQVTRGIPRVRLDIGVPGGELVVKEPDDPRQRDVAHALKEAFNVARRQLRERRKRETGDGKRREMPPHGRVLRLMPDEPGGRYGFILSGDGRQIYFHENAVRTTSYDDLVEGMEVHFTEAGGKEGPQASSVLPVDIAELRAHEEETPLSEPR